jgi:hypothetical protein
MRGIGFALLGFGLLALLVSGDVEITHPYDELSAYEALGQTIGLILWPLLSMSVGSLLVWKGRKRVK